MLEHLAVHEPVKGCDQHLAQADKRVDSENHRDAAFEAAHGANRDVGTALELGLAPSSGFTQHLHPTADAPGDFSVGFGGLPVRPPRSLCALLRRHSAQLRHCETPGQAGQVFSL